MQIHLRELRKKKGLTVEQLAERALISAAAIDKYEAGKTIPRLDFAALLARGLGCTIDELITLEDADIEGRE